METVTTDDIAAVHDVVEGDKFLIEITFIVNNRKQYKSAIDMGR